MVGILVVAVALAALAVLLAGTRPKKPRRKKASAEGRPVDSSTAKKRRNPRRYGLTYKDARDELRELKRNGASTVVVITARDEHVCAGCRALEGQRLAIDDALRDLPAPAHCTTEKDSPDDGIGCRCTYAAG